MDESYDNNDEIIRKPILPKNLNLKMGMTVYKMKLEEKKKQEKKTKIAEKLDTKQSQYSHSPRKWHADTDITGIFLIRNLIMFILILEIYKTTLISCFFNLRIYLIIS